MTCLYAERSLSASRASAAAAAAVAIVTCSTQLHLVEYRTYTHSATPCCMHHTHVSSTGAAKWGGARSPRNWVHKKIPGCAVELNTQNSGWFGSQISLVTAMSFREAMPPPRTTHQGLCPWTPLEDFRSPDPLCPHLQILATPLVSACIYGTAASISCRRLQ